MITQTIKEAIMDDRAITPGYVYVIRDGDVVFYVGMSNDPTFRLCQHLGIADRHNFICPRKKLMQHMESGNLDIVDSLGLYVNQVGTCILNNVPDSLEWQFDIYEKEDAIAVMKRTELAQALPRVLEIMQIDWHNQRTLVENALINELKPYLNAINNAHERNVPEKYRRRVNLDNNAADYIRLESSSLALDL